MTWLKYTSHQKPSIFTLSFIPRTATRFATLFLQIKGFPNCLIFILYMKADVTKNYMYYNKKPTLWKIIWKSFHINQSFLFLYSVAIESMFIFIIIFQFFLHKQINVSHTDSLILVSTFVSSLASLPCSFFFSLISSSIFSFFLFSFSSWWFFLLISSEISSMSRSL